MEQSGCRRACDSSTKKAGHHMTKITYEIVEHDGGWAYSVGGAYSETFPTYPRARAAAEQAAARQKLGGVTTGISYEDRQGQ